MYPRRSLQILPWWGWQWWEESAVRTRTTLFWIVLFRGSIFQIILFLDESKRSFIVSVTWDLKRASQHEVQNIVLLIHTHLWYLCLWLSKENVERRRTETIIGSGGGGRAAAAAEDPGVEERKQSTLTKFGVLGVWSEEEYLQEVRLLCEYNVFFFSCFFVCMPYVPA